MLSIWHKLRESERTVKHNTTTTINFTALYDEGVSVPTELRIPMPIFRVRRRQKQKQLAAAKANGDENSFLLSSVFFYVRWLVAVRRLLSSSLFNSLVRVVHIFGGGSFDLN